MKTNKKIAFFEHSINTLIESENQITPKQIRRRLSKVAKQRDLPSKLVSNYNRFILIIFSIEGFSFI